MEPELNREYPEAGENGLIEEMVRLARNRMQRLAKKMPEENGCMHRGQHAKPTGCVRAVFAVRDDLLDYLSHGVFKQPAKTFQAVVRFSNSLGTFDPDGKRAGRGMAIKLFDVDGTPAIPGASHRCQDFLMFSYPVFPFATPAEYVQFFEIREADVAGDRVADLMALVHLAATQPRHALIAKAIVEKKVASPLELTYWSGSPFWLGPPATTGGRTVKYSVVPTFTGTACPDDPDSMPPDYLSEALERHLKEREAVFDFQVQLQTDPVRMPVEDVSVEWDETESSPIRVATLTIGVQDVRSQAGEALARQCEAMAFSPWNALAEHRPMGGINRLRKAVYLASQELRGAGGAC
jgi:hypothetical protein